MALPCHQCQGLLPSIHCSSCMRLLISLYSPCSGAGANPSTQPGLVPEPGRLLGSGISFLANSLVCMSPGHPWTLAA